jgi:ribose transport system permease protein
MGANPTAGRLALIPPVLLSMIVFALSALFAAVTGILLAGFSGGADPSVGDPYLFTTIAAVVIGGTSLIGGRGGYGRTIAGVLLITVLTTLLVGLGASDAIQQMLLGVLIVVMIAIYGRQRRVREEV